MRPLRLLLPAEPQPDAQAHPELQLQRNGHQAQTILLLILSCRTLRSTMVRTNQVVLAIPLTRIGATLQPHELYGGSRDYGASANLGWPRDSD
jgi:hypothetical protein